MEVNLQDFDPNKATKVVLEQELKKHGVSFPSSSSKSKLVALFREIQRDGEKKSLSSTKKETVKNDDSEDKKKSKRKSDQNVEKVPKQTKKRKTDSPKKEEIKEDETNSDKPEKKETKKPKRRVKLPPSPSRHAMERRSSSNVFQSGQKVTPTKEESNSENDVDEQISQNSNKEQTFQDSASDGEENIPQIEGSQVDDQSSDSSLQAPAPAPTSNWCSIL